MLRSVARTPTLDPELAATIRRLREEQGISREGLALHSGITTGSLARIELGQSVPGWDTVRRLAKALDITLVALAAAIEAQPDHEPSTDPVEKPNQVDENAAPCPSSAAPAQELLRP
jgi:transcriptional regulator with XRE-family HTH domain